MMAKFTGIIEQNQFETEWSVPWKFLERGGGIGYVELTLDVWCFHIYDKLLAVSGTIWKQNVSISRIEPFFRLEFIWFCTLNSFQW